MNEIKILEELQEILETDSKVTRETILDGNPDYNSLAIMGLIAFIDENFNITVAGDKLLKLKNVGQLLELISSD